MLNRSKPQGASGYRLAGQTVAAASETPVNWLVAALVLLDIYVICGRAPEVLYILTGIRVPLWPVLLHWMTLAVGMIGGETRRVVFSKPSLLLLLFTGWILLSLPMSVDRRGSLDVLTRSWLPSFLAFYVVSSNVRSLSLLKKIGVVIGLCSLQIALLSLLLGKNLQDRFSMEIGTLANANDLAALLLYGLPFLVYLGIRPSAGVLMQLLAAALVACVLLLVLRTGSRSGVLTMALITLAGMFWSGWILRMKLLVAGVVAVVLVIPFVPSYSLQRIGTIVDQDSMGAGEEANVSRQTRTDLFFTSLRLATQNPIFGVGIGEFQAADYQEGLRTGRRAKWVAPHNTLGQVASENGFPALLLYVSFLVVILFRINSTRRMWRRAEGWGENYGIAMCLELALIGYLFNCMFGSNAYLPYMPVLAGLCEAFYRITVHQMQIRSAAASQSPGSPAGRRKPLLPQNPLPTRQPGRLHWRTP